MIVDAHDVAVHVRVPDYCLDCGLPLAAGAAPTCGCEWLHDAGRLIDPVVLDWRTGHWSKEPRPCARCGRPTHLHTAAGRPAHKTCVERMLRDQMPGRSA